MNKCLRHQSDPILEERTTDGRAHVDRHGTSRVALEQVLNAVPSERAAIRVNKTRSREDIGICCLGKDATVHGGFLLTAGILRDSSSDHKLEARELVHFVTHSRLGLPFDHGKLLWYIQASKVDCDIKVSDI